MTKNTLIIALLAASLIGVLLLWPRNSCQASGDCPIKSSSPVQPSKAQQIQAEVQAGKAALLDVREADEYQAGHAPDSQLLPLSSIEAGAFKMSDKSMKVYLYCRSGRRASAAADALRIQGYTNLEEIGGLTDWEKIGGDIIVK